MKSGVFDLVSANMVVEHIANPELVGKNLNRILKPGRLFIFHTPNFRNYQTRLVSWLPQGLKNSLAKHLEQREEKDVFPTCYRMNTAEAIRQLADRTGFEVQQVQSGQFHAGDFCPRTGRASDRNAHHQRLGTALVLAMAEVTWWWSSGSLNQLLTPSRARNRASPGGDGNGP